MAAGLQRRPPGSREAWTRLSAALGSRWTSLASVSTGAEALTRELSMVLTVPTGYLSSPPAFQSSFRGSGLLCPPSRSLSPRGADSPRSPHG